MENMKFFQKDMITEEHSHSLKWYQNQIIEIFQNYERKIQTDNETESLIVKENNVWKVNPFPEPQEDEQIHAYYMRIPYNFSTVFSRVYCDNQDILQKDNSFYYLFRIELFKIMNLIDLLCTKICNYNIDESVFNNGFDLINARYAFIWLMCFSNSPQDIDAQDFNRLKAFYRLQLELKFKSEEKYYDNKLLDKKYAIIAKKIEGKDIDTSWRNRIVRYLSKLKKGLEALINETFDAYDILIKYRSYLFECDSDIKNSDLSAMKYALILAKTISRIYIERFSAFLKISDLNLSNSVFNSAYFTRANASDSNFINSNFYRARLDNAVMNGCDFSVCNFNKAEARDAKFDNCTFNYSTMSGIDLQNASLKNSLFDSVIFRDPQLDTNIEFIKHFVNILEGKKSSEQLSVLINERQKIFNKKEKNDRCFADDKLSDLYKMLCRDNNDKSIWNLTVAGESDESVHICKIDKEGNVNDYKSTVFDDIYYQVSKILDEIYEVCQKSVINTELLDLLIKAESEENGSDRRKRISKNGDFCLEKTNLYGAVVANSSLHQVDFSHINLSNASFENSDLSECMAYYCNAEIASFYSANINESIFFDSCFADANFSKANCINSCFINCKMEGINLSDATAIGMKIINTNRRKTFIGELLQPVSLNSFDDNKIVSLTENIDDKKDFAEEKYTLIDSNWKGITASKSIIISMLVDRSNFNNADLRNTLFLNNVMRWSDFENVDASYTLLLGDSFHQSSFNHINLSQSHNFACEFSGCQMLNTNFIGARCDKLIFYDSDLSNSNFSHCLFKNCIFRDCNFKNINMSNVDFVNCVFSNVDFNDCLGMTSAVFKECVFVGFTSISSDNFDVEDGDAYIILQEKGSQSDTRVNFAKQDFTGKFELYSN